MRRLSSLNAKMLGLTLAIVGITHTVTFASDATNQAGTNPVDNTNLPPQSGMQDPTPANNPVVPMEKSLETPQVPAAPETGHTDKPVAPCCAHKEHENKNDAVAAPQGVTSSNIEGAIAEKPQTLQAPEAPKAPQTSAASPASSLQDTQRAEAFFTDELNFTTNPHGLNKAIETKDPTIIVVDLRDEDAFKKGHVPGAVNMPWKKYNGFDGAETSFAELSKEKIAYVYCYEPLCNLGAKAARKFASLGYPVKEVRGGYDAWVKMGGKPAV